MIVIDQIGQFGNWIGSWFTKEEQIIVAFFGPLMDQVKAAALQLGKDDLALGIRVLENAAMAAVAAAAAAAPGTQIAVAEAMFLEIMAAEGVTFIHNAEAGLIKAAVAIFQTKNHTANTAQPAVAASKKTYRHPFDR